MTRLLLNLILDALFGKQEKIERRTTPIRSNPMPSTPPEHVIARLGLPPEDER